AQVDGVFAEGDGVDAFEQAVQERGGEVGVAEERGPFLVSEVCSKKRAFLSGALIDEAEELVDLIRLGVHIAHFIDDQKVQTRQAVQEQLGGAVGDRGAELVKEVLGFYAA